MLNLTACPSAEELKALSFGDTSDENSEALFEHIQTCDACRGEMETLEDAEDSLISSLRAPDVLAAFQQEPQCNIAVSKALGALANVESANHQVTEMPQAIGEYEIIRPIGRGGMGNVFLASHTKLGRKVALKVLATHRLADGRMRQRFESEMRAIGRLSHPNIVTAHDARDVDGTAVLVTEFIDGMDLGQVVQRTGPIAIADACEISRQVAIALEYTSGQGFVHRDVKPSNIMLSGNGDVKLLDLGLARLQQVESVEDITYTGQAMGTADYVAPEQVNDSRSVDVRADVYALGCTLFKLLTGRAPFADDRHTTAFAKMTAHVSTSPPSLGDQLPAAPAKLTRLVESMLAKAASDRPQSAGKVAELLKPFCDGCDLKKLIVDAHSCDGKVDVAATASTEKNQGTVAFMQRNVPAWTAIAGALLALVLGLFLGVIIKIKYPDGTEISIPLQPGSKVSMEQDASGTSQGDNASDSGVSRADVGPADASGDSAQSGKRNEAFSPLSFAILATGPEPAKPESVQNSISEGRQRLLGSQTTPKGWYPIDPSIETESKTIHKGQYYALASTHRLGAIGWKEIHGHVVNTMASQRSLSLEFDQQLADRMQIVSGAHPNRQLAIIFNGRIVAAPYLRSVISNRAEIMGSFTSEEIKYLQQCLHGGLVDPLPLEKEAVHVVTQDPEPLGFVILPNHSSTGRAPFVGAVAIAAAKDTLHRSKSGKPVVTDAGIWYPMVGDVSVPVMEYSGGVAYALASGFPQDQLMWSSIQGHIEVANFTKRRTIGMVDLTLDDELATKLSALSSANVRNQLGIIVNGKLRASPTINSKIGKKVRIEGVYTDDELENLSHWLSAAIEKHSGEEAVEATGLQGASKIEVDAEPTDAQKEALSKSNLKKIGVAFQNFHDVYGKFPGSSNTREGGRSHGKDKKIYPFSWRVAILPFIGENELYEQYRFDEPWDSKSNSELLKKMPDTYRNPNAATTREGHSNYAGIVGDGTGLGIHGGQRQEDFSDGLKNTLLIMESRRSFQWTDPSDLAVNDLLLFAWGKQAPDPHEKRIAMLIQNHEDHLFNMREGRIDPETGQGSARDRLAVEAKSLALMDRIKWLTSKSRELQNLLSRPSLAPGKWSDGNRVSCLLADGSVHSIEITNLEKFYQLFFFDDDTTPQVSQ